MTKEQLNDSIEKACNDYVNKYLNKDDLSERINIIADRNSNDSNAIFADFALSESINFSKHLVQQVLSDVLDIHD